MSFLTTPFARFLAAQTVLVALIAAVVLLGNHSAPRLRLDEAVIGPTDPVTLFPSRPLDRTSFEQGFRLTLDGEPVAGVFQWTTRSVSFIPDEPLQSEGRYEINVEGATDRQGTPLRSPFQAAVTVRPAAFLYVTPSKELARYTVRSSEFEVLSQPGHEVLAYAVAADGSRIVYSYRLPLTNAYGLMSLEGDGFRERSIVTGGERAFYDRLALCGPSGQLVALRNEMDRDGIVTGSRYVSFRDSGPYDLLPEGRLNSQPEFACTSLSEQFLYRDVEGLLQLSRLSRPEETDSLGRYDVAYGFSPRGGGILAGVVNPDDPTKRLVYRIDANGIRQLISDSRYDVSDPSFNALETLLVRSENREVTPGSISMHGQIVLSTFGESAVRQMVVTEPLATLSDERPRWSADGRYVAFERITLSSRTDRPQDSQGRPLDAELMLFEVPADTALLQERLPEVRSLQIWGGSVTWLP